MSKIDFAEDILSDVLDYLNDKYNQKSVYLGGTKIPNFEEYHGVLLLQLLMIGCIPYGNLTCIGFIVIGIQLMK